MSTALDPSVASKLRRFGRRRFQLLVIRGICAALVTFLLCMAIVALIDWYWVLTEEMRWSLSGAGYFITLSVVWMTSLRKLVHMPAREEIAAQIETTEPGLREHLLSAVELATDNPSALHDSPVFRSLLQGKVAQQMAGIRIGNLLPMRLLAKWAIGAVLIVTVVAAILNSPDPRFRTLAARAVLPGANIERVSRIHVDVVQPSPTSLTVAKDETVAVIVEVSGGEVSEVTLETFTSDGKQQRQIMRARSSSEFAANIHVTADATEYRVLAGDAVTRKYTIVAKDRPSVVAFHKTYRYPDYAGLEDVSVTEDHGDIVVLEGTQAELRLELDQAVSSAELRLDTTSSEEVSAIPLKASDTGQWSAIVPVDDSAIYKVHLVSKETGFENIFSPRYEIRPLPDLIPRVGFVDQQETNLLLPPNDILALKGMAEDDLPLATMEQEFSINGYEWQSLPLEVTRVDPTVINDQADVNSHRITSTWDWDLLGLKLKTGDQVTTRLVAIDRKGNRGESVPLRIVVSAPDFDPDRHVNMQQKATLYDALAKLATVAEEHKVTALEIIKRLRDELDLTPEQQRTTEEQTLDRTTLADLADNLRAESRQVLGEIESVTRSMPVGADAYDLDLTGRVVARLHNEHARTPEYLLAAIQHTEQKSRVQKVLDDLKRAFERSADDAKAVAYHYQSLMNHNIVAAVAIDFDALLRQQELVVNSPTQSWSRLLRQETVVLNQLDVVSRLMEDQHHRLTGHLQNVFRQFIDWSHSRREQLEQATESEDKLPELQRLAPTLLRELKDRQRVEVLDGGLAERLNQARREFDSRSGTLYDPLSQMVNATQEENRLSVQANEAEDSIKAKELNEQAKRFAAETTLKQHSLEQLRARRQLTQCRLDADAQFAADAGLTHRAVTAVLHQHRSRDPKETFVPDAFREIAPAYRVLEAGHEVKNVQACLWTLIQLERWGSQDLVAKIEHPRQWDVFQKGLDEAINKLRRAGVDHQLMSKFDQVRWSTPAREAGRKIGQRRWAREDMLGASLDLMELRDMFGPVMYELEPIMAEARATIAKYAPTIPQMAQMAAEQLRQLEEQTTDVAEHVEEQTQQPPTSENQAAPELADLRKQQERINEQIDDLFEALVEDANTQDLLDREQRERARDADDSIAMIQQPAQQMNEALQRAEATPAPDQQAKELAKAAEQQEKTAQALKKVAEHFDRLDQSMDVAESRAELRQEERESSMATELEQKFANVEQLVSTAQQSPQDLMSELEAELKQNPAMQQALSEIAEKAVQEARNALQDAAHREQNLQRDNERSDAEFQAKKRELAEDLRELGREAAKLSSQLVAQANTAASQAKTSEAQKNFAETQQKLAEAANAANSANENELQADLAERLQQAKQALKQASETLQTAKDQSAAGKNEEIHADEKARQAAKKDQEDRRKRFMDQRKREADAAKRNAENAERQTDQQVRNEENNLRRAESQVKQTQNNLNRKPDDNNLQRAVAQAESQREAAQTKVDQAKERRDFAQQNTAAAREARAKLDRLPQPSLDDKNPAAQLAEAYAGEAVEVANQLNRKAEELAKGADFGNELAPTKEQLAAATTQQELVKTDVAQTAEDIARAARHERRLEKSVTAAALEQASQNIEQVANNEATRAQQQLNTANAALATPSEGEAQAPPDNKPAIAANQALAESERAIAQQADSLTATLSPMQEAHAADADAVLAGQEPHETGQGARPDIPQANDTLSTGAAETSTAANAPQTFTPEEMAAGRELAQTLDELDRLQAQPAAAAAQDGQPSPVQQALAQRPNLAQAAQTQQGQMAAARAQAQQQSALAANPTGYQQEGTPAYEGQAEAFLLQAVNREEDKDWGMLREQAADDLTKGRKEVVSEEYRKSVETYFRVLAERARRGQN
ncbi:MAG: hypothetical protein H6822_19820 [Planctomycetaceae bacterium]|nr:hypothetical protein [Planctomycetales bacterium]MCB9924436.1 hypothetical protein [Planctomycetaceae bacterium]